MNQQQCNEFVTRLKAKGASIIEQEWTEYAVGKVRSPRLRIRGKESELSTDEIKVAYRRWIKQILDQLGLD